MLPPLAKPYHFLRINKPPYRLYVEWNGIIPDCFNVNEYPFTLLASVPEDKSMKVKMGLVGGYLPAVNIGYFDEERAIGWEEIVFTYEDEDFNSNLYVRIRIFKDGSVEDYYFTGIPAKPITDKKTFYKALLALKVKWDTFLSKGTSVYTPEERVNDAYKAGLIIALENLEGREWPRRPKYGSKSYAEEIHNTFPPATQAVAECLLDWGYICLLYTSPSPRDLSTSRMPSSA